MTTGSRAGIPARQPVLDDSARSGLFLSVQARYRPATWRTRRHAGIVRVESAAFQGFAAGRVMMELVDLSGDAGVLKGVDRSEANGRLQACSADARLAGFKKRLHRGGIDRVVRLVIGIPGVGDPFRLVHHLPGIDDGGMSLRNAQQGIERFFEESLSLVRIRDGISSSLFHPAGIWVWCQRSLRIAARVTEVEVDEDG